MTAPLRTRARRRIDLPTNPDDGVIAEARAASRTAVALQEPTPDRGPARSVTGHRPRPPAPAAVTAPAPPVDRPVATGAGHQLDLALTDLAEVLAVYPFRSAMAACPHCVTDDDIRVLGRSPERIPDAVLDRFASKALVTWGEVPDLKRLLPEILTRMASGRLGPPPALVGARLRRAGWLEWPAAETPAVRRALRATWLATLVDLPGPGHTPVGRTLGLVASAEDDLGPYLELWEDRLETPGNPAARLAAVLHLADLLGPLADGGRRRLLRTLPLARRSVVGQLDQWLRQPVVGRRLAHAGDALRSTPHHARVSRAREGMARLRTDR